MTNEPEGREGATAAPDAADAAAEATATAAEEARGEAIAEAATPETVEGVATPETLAEAATPATIHTPAPAAEDASGITTTPPSPQDGARLSNSLETIKTAIVWLVVIQILTILSPLLRVSLKWALIVGTVLTLGSFAVAVLAYLKAQRAQRGLPE
ncbi:MAG TPA: hypothetical protein VIQ24_14545 [Pyrinomonadaceae bacterium]